jgi:hypothetical protein
LVKGAIFVGIAEGETARRWLMGHTAAKTSSRLMLQHAGSLATKGLHR